VATEFRTDGEWKDIIHRIRITAFELGMLLNEKRTDTIVIPDRGFDVNADACEFLTSVLLTSPAGPQESSSIDDCGDAQVQSSVDETGDFDGYFSGDTHPDSLAASVPLIAGVSTNFSSTIETLNTPITHSTPMSSTEYGNFRNTRPSMPTQQGPAMVDYPRADTRMSNDSSQAFEPLVTSHEKVCFWCVKEGTSNDGTPTTEPNLGSFESGEFHNQSTNNAPAPESRNLDIQKMTSVDVNLEGSNNLHQIGELPGLCRVDDLPPLLYRWSNTSSQGINTDTVLVAGWFSADYRDVGPPSQMSEIDFLNVFAAHVTRVQVPTPFISAFARPLSPIHRGLRNRAGAKLSVIDPRRLPTPVFNAQPLAQVTGTTVARWKGYGEFAIWGYVPSEAIICTFDIASLEGIASRDLEIQQFLQLPLIEAEETCHRRLRRDLRRNLQTCSYEENCLVLRRLADKLDIPEQYQVDFATDVHRAWTMDLGDTYRGRDEPDANYAEILPAPVPAMSGETHEDPQRVVRCSSKSTASYVPPKSDDGSCSESTSEEVDNLSQSPEAPCPRRDTPSPAFSVVSDGDDSVQVNIPRSRALEVEMLEVAIPPTPPSTSRYFARLANVNVNVGSAIPPLNLSRLSLSNSSNDDRYLSETAEWPSDDETLAGNDTPARSRYFDLHGNERENGGSQVSRFTIQGRNPFVPGEDDVAGL
jgi:hypothetical protein